MEKKNKKNIKKSQQTTKLNKKLLNDAEDYNNAHLDAAEEIMCVHVKKRAKYQEDTKTKTMTLTEYNAWKLWESHGLSRKQFEDHETYEQNCEALRNYRIYCSGKEYNTDNTDQEYETNLLKKIKEFEDDMDARMKEEEARMDEWILFNLI
jgi:hypothetical protein